MFKHTSRCIGDVLAGRYRHLIMLYMVQASEESMLCLNFSPLSRTFWYFPPHSLPPTQGTVQKVQERSSVGKGLAYEGPGFQDECGGSTDL